MFPALASIPCTIFSDTLTEQDT
uniref:Uncharacterized protein n=1 Tax=Arundo donax TaxID=35708 RepID=A0A0A8YHZ0_ARUDO